MGYLMVWKNVFINYCAVLSCIKNNQVLKSSQFVDRDTVEEEVFEENKLQGLYIFPDLL